jgi:hypothetical protein
MLRYGKPHYRPTRRRLVAGWPIQVGPRVQIARKKANWLATPRPEFHGFIAALAGLERRSPTGSVRNHYRRRRLAAVKFYERVFGPAPDVLRDRKLKTGAAFYGTPQYKQWSASAYEPPKPVSERTSAA